MKADFKVLPAPSGYLLIEIDDDDSQLVEKRLSEPIPIIGFAVRSYVNSPNLHVDPITATDVHSDESSYAIVFPDGRVYLLRFGPAMLRDVDDLKQYLRHFASEAYRECAEDMKKDGDLEGAAEMARVARKHRREWKDNS